MKIENVDFNGKQYTLIDKYDDYKRDMILYYFAGDEDDKFAIKKNNKYILIEDKKEIEKIKEKYDLNPPEVYFAKSLVGTIYMLKNERKLDDKEIKEKNVEKICDFVKSAQKGKLLKRLKHVDYYIAEWSNKSNVQGFYHPGTNNVYLQYGDEKENSSTNMHETIHAITGNIASFTKFLLYKGFIERSN